MTMCLMSIVLLILLYLHSTQAIPKCADQKAVCGDVCTNNCQQQIRKKGNSVEGFMCCIEQGGSCPFYADNNQNSKSWNSYALSVWTVRYPRPHFASGRCPNGFDYAICIAPWQLKFMDVETVELEYGHLGGHTGYKGICTESKFSAKPSATYTNAKGTVVTLVDGNALEKNSKLYSKLMKEEANQLKKERKTEEKKEKKRKSSAKKKLKQQQKDAKKSKSKSKKKTLFSKAHIDYDDAVFNAEKSYNEMLSEYEYDAAAEYLHEQRAERVLAEERKQILRAKQRAQQAKRRKYQNK